MVDPWTKWQEFDHWSASQIETFRMCQRKWWLNKIAGIKIEGTGDTNIGTAVHGVAEDFFATGDVTAVEASPYANTVRPALAKLTELRALNPKIEFPIGANKRLEHKNEAPLIVLAGLPGEGYIDVLSLDTPVPEVWDHKTTGNMRYAKTEEELRNNIQLMIYGKAAFILRPDASLVRLGHIVYLKVPPHGVRVTEVTVPREHVDAEMEQIERTVEDMRRIALVRDGEVVTPSWDACSAFGGCPFRDRCKATKRDASSGTTSLFAQPGDTTMGNPLLDRLNRTAGVAATADIIVRPEAAEARVDDAAAALRAKLMSAQSAPAGILPPDAPAASVSRPRGSQEKVLALGWKQNQFDRMSVPTIRDILEKLLTPEGFSILPNGDLFEVEGTEEEAETPLPDLASGTAVEMGAALGWNEAQMNDMDDPTFASVLRGRFTPLTHTLDKGVLKLIPPPVEPVAPKTRAARKAKVVEPVVEPVVEAPAQEPAAEVATTGTDGEKTAPEPGPINGKDMTPRMLVLLIDTHPIRGGAVFGDVAVHLEDYLAPMMRTVAEHSKVPHYGVVNDFGKGAKEVIALLAQNPPTGVVLVDSRMPLSAAALEVLLPLAAVAFRGTK